MDLFNKCNAIVKQVNRAHAMEIYPFFTPIESVQDHRVMINGREFIMIGSNGYLGLAADPRMKEAGINAIKKYGSSMSNWKMI
jgi:8-amino-7-oxononanoate synthase